MLEPPSMKARSCDVKEYMSLDSCNTPLADFRDLFRGQLSVFRVESDHYRRMSEIGTGMRPRSSRGGDEERMEDGT